MYNSRFVADNGNTFYFGFYYGTIFDIDPLSELDVDVSTAQGFQQTGATVNSESVGGVSREIRGVFVDASNVTLAQQLLDTFSPGTHGKLYYNNDYYCECVVEKTPAMTLNNRKRTFDLMLYCPYPYWLSSDTSTYTIGGYIEAFELPVCYDSHVFGIANGSVMTDVYNAGAVERPISVKFRCLTSVSNYGIENVETDEILKIDDTLQIGETVDVYWEDGKLKVEKTVDGVTTDIFSLLDEESALFSVASGSNIYKQFADDSTDQLIVTVTMCPAIVGIAADV